MLALHASLEQIATIVESAGYVTARSNRPDVSRSANHILRMSLEGKITLAYLPPGYVSQKTRDEYENHPDLVRISQLLALYKHQEEDEPENNLDFDSPDEKDEVDEERAVVRKAGRLQW